MGLAERKRRERADRETRIVMAARAIAVREGWPAVTIRRLAEEIEFSQPVLYSHFENRDAIVAAVAVEGFVELTAAMRAACTPGYPETLERVARAYLTFAAQQPALYDAMFAMPTSLRFAEAGTRPELHEAFAALRAAVPTAASIADVATETLWAALHGLAELERSGRIRPAFSRERLTLIVKAISSLADLSEAS